MFFRTVFFSACLWFETLASDISLEIMLVLALFGTKAFICSGDVPLNWDRGGRVSIWDMVWDPIQQAFRAMGASSVTNCFATNRGCSQKNGTATNQKVHLIKTNIEMKRHVLEQSMSLPSNFVKWSLIWQSRRFWKLWTSKVVGNPTSTGGACWASGEMFKEPSWPTSWEE